MNRNFTRVVCLLSWAMVLSLTNQASAQTTAWDQTLACTTPVNCPRFLVLSNMNSAAVLDRETGLVWERSPDTTLRTWLDAHAHCIRMTGGAPTTAKRLGWRLPTVQELASLVDPNNVDPTRVKPALPPGHPFGNVRTTVYWSATTFATDSSFAWEVNFRVGIVDPNQKSIPTPVWCVRGGQGVDPQ